MALEYKRMSLFDAPKGSVLFHAVNSQGVWGSGVAREFHERFPKSFVQYRNACYNHYAPGSTLICKPENNYSVGCLFTSKSYGSSVDSIDTIINNTKLALVVLEMMDNGAPCTYYSNKFNSGLFRVPWGRTEQETLLPFLRDNPNITWIVCDPEMKE